MQVLGQSMTTGSAMDASAGGFDALTLGHAGVQSEGQNVHGANEHLPEGGAYEARGHGEEGHALGEQ